MQKPCDFNRIATIQVEEKRGEIYYKLVDIVGNANN